MAAFPHASLQCARCLVSDCVVGTQVAAVVEGHPKAQRQWSHAEDIPFSTRLYGVGDLKLVTDMWVEFRHPEPTG
eukprot:2071317-Prorocentrum_lima.AAC.1